MKAFGVFMPICIAALLTTAKADGTCETIKDYDWFGTVKTCIMRWTAIDSKDFLITSGRDESVEGFLAYGNEKFEYLPNNIGAKFPNLHRLSAAGCSIREVSKDNFRRLEKLRELSLWNNQIESIEDDTFEYIPAVKVIDLDRNKIKKLNGRAFALLHQLTRVYLYNNECINEDFDTATRIAELPRVVTGRCGFTESKKKTRNAKFEADLMVQSKELQAHKLRNVDGTW